MRTSDTQSAAGKSLLEKLWEELDVITDRLITEGPPDRDPQRQDWVHYGELRGQAQGIAYAIAIIENPYEPDMPGVKDRAMERWEAEHGES